MRQPACGYLFSLAQTIQHSNEKKKREYSRALLHFVVGFGEGRGLVREAFFGAQRKGGVIMGNGKRLLDTLMDVLESRVWPGKAAPEERENIGRQVGEAVRLIIFSMENKSVGERRGNQWFSYISQGELSVKIMNGPGRSDGIRTYDPKRGSLGSYVQTMIAYQLISAMRRFGREVPLPPSEGNSRESVNSQPEFNIEDMREKFMIYLGVYGILCRGRGLRAIVLDALIEFIEERGNYRPSYQELHRHLQARGISRHERYVLHTQQGIYNWIKDNSKNIEDLFQKLKMTLEKHASTILAKDAEGVIVGLMLEKARMNRSFYFTESMIVSLAGSGGMTLSIAGVMALRNKAHNHMCTIAGLR